MRTTSDAILLVLTDRWVRRGDLPGLLRHRFSLSLMQRSLADLIAKRLIWRRLDVVGGHLEPSYTRARATGDIVIPAGVRSEGVFCPCCGASRAHWRPF